MNACIIKHYNHSSFICNLCKSWLKLLIKEFNELGKFIFIGCFTFHHKICFFILLSSNNIKSLGTRSNNTLSISFFFHPRVKWQSRWTKWTLVYPNNHKSNFLSLLINSRNILLASSNQLWNHQGRRWDAFLYPKFITLLIKKIYFIIVSLIVYIFFINSIVYVLSKWNKYIIIFKQSIIKSYEHSLIFSSIFLIIFILFSQSLLTFELS